ncbi:MAG: M16 family metallopeptidase [Limnobacter sp.]|uniref:M16 family metallopeptidase n=1 Tax=Limnobacter sp. TaxID=2003368 RepID=UPI00391CD9CF
MFLISFAKQFTQRSPIQWPWVRMFTLLVFGSALAFMVEPAGLARAADGDVSQYVLPNGLRLVVKEDHRSPTVAHMVWYKAGSIDEVNGKTGVAHVLEHMMFKGTRTLKPGEFSKRVAALGGRDNAFTSRDYTAYFQQLQAKDLKAVMALEADRMNNLTLSEAEFKKEIQVVMEERRWRTDDQAQGKLYEAFMATAYQANPTRTPVIGWMNDLEAMTYKDAQAWYHTWYTPKNAVVVVVGDVKPVQVKEWALQTYGRINNPRALPERKPQLEPVQEGVRRVEVKAPAENPYVMIGFKVPKLVNPKTDRDPYALTVLSAVLDGYSGARMNRELVQDSKVAISAGAGYDMTGRGPSMFFLDGTPADGKTVADLEPLLIGQVRKVAESGVSEQELARVKAQLIAGQVYKKDSVFGQAMEIGQNLMIDFEVADIDRMIEQIKSVTPAEVQAVAQRYFQPEQMTVGTLYPLPLDPNKKHDRPKGLTH